VSLPRFGVTKPVPVNLLMAAVLLGGLYCAFIIEREFFPEMTPDSASVTMPYPGATPDEVEQGLAIKIEDRLADLKEVKKLTTTISEGGGGIIVQFHENIRNVYRATDEVERAIEQIMDLPEDAERIRVTEFEPKLHAIMATLYGEADEDVMKRAIRRFRDDLLTLPNMGEVVIDGTREYEIRIDVSTEQMIAHGVSLPQVSDAVRNWMREVPGGTVRTGGGESAAGIGNVNLRAMGIEERADAIGEIIIRSQPDGSTLRVRDIAAVSEYFVDQELFRRHNGVPAVSLIVYKLGDQDIIAIAEMVKAYVDGINDRPFTARGIEHIVGSDRRRAHQLGARRAADSGVPDGCTLEIHSDLARFVQGRLQLLLRNAAQGGVLVFLTLLLFLNWRTALWVGVGLTTALAGTLIFMQIGNITLNLLTMFGLIVVIGLLVDDAIVVAENIQSRHDRGEASLSAAIKGAEQVSWPVVATVLTSIVAFLPLMFIQGRIGDMLGALPLVVACALAMSLIECLLILPSHVGHSLAVRDRKVSDRISLVQRFENWRNSIILDRIVPAYGRFVEKCLNFRYITVAAALAVLIVSVGMVAGGRLPYTFLTSTDSETIIIDIRMPIGTSIAQTEAVAARFERAAVAQLETQSVSASIGGQVDLDTGRPSGISSHLAQIFVELHYVENRERESSLVIDSIRQIVGPVDEAERIRFSEITGGPGGPDITVQVRGDDIDQIMAAVNDIKHELRRFDGVYDIADNSSAGQREIQVNLRPGAAALGFTTSDVANQLRGALFGLDAHVFAAQQEDIDVRVRLDEATRRDLHAVENLWLISPAGQPVPLSEIAELVEGTSYATINRIDRKRAVTVTADTAPGVNPEEVVRKLDLDRIREQHPLVFIEMAGRQQQQADAFASLPIGYLAALVMIYVILAWLFSSYWQPIAVMLAIPFGLIGVIWGHVLLGYELTFLSMIGFVALSGVVVNDSLILVRFYNDKFAEGLPIRDALVAAGRARFRPILLTTITTVLGLTPLMLEQSFQAKFLIPMAIAIAFGLMSATLVILVVLPAIMVIFDDVKRTLYYGWHGLPRPERTPTAPAVPPGAEPIGE
jgi:hydrophobic/amphiphilic exporter-1 (mainly G- bacteria), HAE1 family